jgi:hypothetical protein
VARMPSGEYGFEWISQRDSHRAFGAPLRVRFTLEPGRAAFIGRVGIAFAARLGASFVVSVTADRPPPELGTVGAWQERAAKALAHPAKSRAVWQQRRRTHTDEIGPLLSYGGSDVVRGKHRKKVEAERLTTLTLHGRPVLGTPAGDSEPGPAHPEVAARK